MLKIKSVYDPPDKSDGLRILATRYMIQGLKKEKYDIWMPSLGPSEVLLKSVPDKITWAEFKKRYKEELLMDGPIDKKCKTIKNHNQKFTLRLIKKLSTKGNVTLMCHLPDNELSYLHILKEFILSKKI